MSSTLNKAMLIGYLGTDPEKIAISEGKTKVSFRMATTLVWADRLTKKKRETTDWHTVVTMNKPLGQQLMESLKKGSRVYVEGRITENKWIGKDGNPRNQTTIIAFSVIFLSPHPYKNQETFLPKDIEDTPNDDDEIPF